MKTPADLLIHLFAGRVSRKTFLLSHLAVLSAYLIWSPLLMVIGNIIGGIMGTLNLNPNESIQIVFVVLFGIIFVTLILMISFMQLSLTIRRLHDCNKSGWYYLSVLIPYIGGLFLLAYCLLMKGTAGENRYGKRKNRTLINEIFNLSK